MRSPRTGNQGSPKNYPVDKNRIPQPCPRRVRNYPLDDSARIPQGLEGYTRWVRSRGPSGELKYPLGDSARITRELHPSGVLARTLWRINSGKPKHPPGDSVRITRGLGVYCRGLNTGVPNEVELITIEH